MSAATVALVFGVSVVGGSGAGASFPGSNGKIAYEVGTDIHVIEPTGTGGVRLTSGVDPAWSADGSLLAFSRGSTSDHDIFVANADGTGERSITSGSADDRNPSWSPSGGEIVFERGGAGLFVVGSDGSNLRQLTTGPDQTPDWSPGGATIAFGSTRDQEHRAIYLVNPDGSNLHQLTAGIGGSSGESDPSWAPDGGALVYARQGNACTARLRVVQADGTGDRALADAGCEPPQPAWSPDGTTIVFHTKAPGASPGHLALIRPDGTGLTDLTTGEGANPSWQRLAQSSTTSTTSTTGTSAPASTTRLAQATTTTAAPAATTTSAASSPTTSRATTTTGAVAVATSAPGTLVRTGSDSDGLFWLALEGVLLGSLILLAIGNRRAPASPGGVDWRRGRPRRRRPRV